MEMSNEVYGEVSRLSSMLLWCMYVLFHHRKDFYEAFKWLDKCREVRMKVWRFREMNWISNKDQGSELTWRKNLKSARIWAKSLQNKLNVNKSAGISAKTGKLAPLKDAWICQYFWNVLSPACFFLWILWNISGAVTFELFLWCIQKHIFGLEMMHRIHFNIKFDQNTY